MMLKKGRGAQKNISNRFDKTTSERIYTDEDIEELEQGVKTKTIIVYPKTIVNKVKSPDVSLEYSMNPYQGCEHGCIYCYARNSHEYWGYGAGIDFERTILVKEKAPELLENHLKNKNWKAYPIFLSGNTDCYQPLERTYELTRQILHIFWKYRHPVSIITKNALIRRDLDILKQLASERLVRVTISITSLQEDIRQKLEPRTASVKQKLKTIQTLAENNIPVQTMMGPIIPGLTNYEIFDIAKRTAEAGSQGFVNTIIRLNGHLGDLFTDWIHQAFPTKADHVLSLIKQMHGGQLNDSRFGTRMTGEGELASTIHKQVKLARAKYFSNSTPFAWNLDSHQFHKTDQLDLFM